ncbi:MAG: nucleotide sugar dehydrogenase [Oceanospirillaceae bacterium]|nr:nucleotide sugar dehydrogenase [Oceanospirillaceae bacterium]MCP5335202.1 nucleotide sugar dehydrogenase [Oceanospirillaceae bacterium]
MNKRRISVIGLGYVGLPVAVAFGNKHPVIGFDINQKRIAELQKNLDRTLEVTSEELEHTNITFTSNAADLAQADFHIVAVPTPINDANQPDLSPLIGASKSVGAYLKKGDIVVYESTVYPGATEEDCVPILEEYSGLKCGEDFFVGYSPERINPGDKDHVFTKIKKVVSGQTPEILEIVADVYGSVVTAGVYKASSIKVAEAAKVIENTQRDLNIALMNELAVIFERMGIDTVDVLEAAGTKWNFLPFRPGLVGGHCIGVDPYYLTHKAQKLGYHPEVISAGRRINDSMPVHVVEQSVKRMIQAGISVKNSRVGILGLTFKENCPDLRNSKVADIVKEFKTYGVELLVHDPMAEMEDALKYYGIGLCNWDDLTDLDAVVLCVSHNQYKSLSAEDFMAMMKPDAVFMDVKSSVNVQEFKAKNINLWRL